MLVPLIVLLFGVSLEGFYAEHLAVIAIGTIGFSALGTIVSAMMVNHNMRDVMIPILLYPLLVPMLIGCVVVTKMLLDGDPSVDHWKYLRILAAIDVVYIAISAGLFRWVLEAIE